MEPSRRMDSEIQKEKLSRRSVSFGRGAGSTEPAPRFICTSLGRFAWAMATIKSVTNRPCAIETSAPTTRIISASNWFEAPTGQTPSHPSHTRRTRAQRSSSSNASAAKVRGARPPDILWHIVAILINTISIRIFASAQANS